MVRGGGKAKGASFERWVCKALSHWVSRGARYDLFWRSAMSGGRATIAGRGGIKLTAQAGDICAVAPEGAALTDLWLVECKHVRDLMLAHLLCEGAGVLASYWAILRAQAAHYDKEPLLIAQQNHRPVMACLSLRAVHMAPLSLRQPAPVQLPALGMCLLPFSDLLQLPPPPYKVGQRQQRVAL